MKRIVLIDDEPGQMDYYCRALRLHHYEVELLDSTDKATSGIESWGSRPPDAVVLDLMLPPGNSFTAQETHNGVTTGLCLLRVIRERFSALPVIILSSYEEKVKEMKNEEKDPALKVVSKYEAPPFEIVRLLGEMIGSAAGEKLAR